MTASLDNRLETPARKKLAVAPNADDSVGVASPENIPPKTARMMKVKGNRYLTISLIRLESYFSFFCPIGAQFGFIRQAMATYTANKKDKIMPGKKPAISNFPTEIPA